MLYNYAFARARVMATRLLGTTKALLSNLEGLMGDVSTDEPIFGAVGVVSRPKPPIAKADATGPNPEGECEALCAKTDDGLHFVAARDLRLNARVNPAVGEVCLVQYGGGFVSLKTASDGYGTQIVLLAPRINSSTGVIAASHALVLDPATANSSVSLVHADGHGLLLTKDGDAILKNSAGDAFLSVSDGVTLSGDLRVPNNNLVVGNPSLAQDVLLAPPAIDLLAVLGASVGAIATAINTLAPGTVTPVQLLQLVAFTLPFAAVGAPTTRAPRILGQPGP